MKRNVLLIVVLGLSLYGVVAGLGHWASSENEALGYSTERMVEAAYRVPARTAYTPPAAGNSAVAVPMSASQGSPSRHTYVPAANYTVSTPMLSGGSYATQGLTLTSQSRQQSYGGSGSSMGTSSSTRMGMGNGSTSGTSYAMGGSMSSGYASSSTYTYSINAGGGIQSNGNMTSTFSPSAVYASAPAPYASFNNHFTPNSILGSYDRVNASEAQLSGCTYLSADDMLDIALGNRSRRRENGRGDETGSGTITEGDKPNTPSLPTPIGSPLVLLSFAALFVLWQRIRGRQAIDNSGNTHQS